VEWDWFSRITGRPTKDLLAECKELGLGSLPGGGAEIFHPEIRDQICEHKADAETWLRIHREAHELGLRSNATMLYGHIEKPWHRIDHLIRLRQLQDETGGFQTFIPLAFHPENSRLAHLPKPSVLTDLKTIAISRLMLDNFPHIKAYWVMLGVKTAQIALSFGADDIDGTVVHEKNLSRRRLQRTSGTHGSRAASPYRRGRPHPCGTRYSVSRNHPRKR
jgi:aminodeoxyfutalosine synthase